MTTAEHLLTILAEECSEVAQRASKALRFGLEEIQPGQPLTNADRVIYEFNDLQAVVYLLQERHLLPSDGTGAQQIERKIAKVKEFLAYSEKCGTVKRDVQSITDCLKGLGSPYPDGKLCFCEMRIGHPNMHAHSAECVQTRAALYPL